MAVSAPGVNPPGPVDSAQGVGFSLSGEFWRCRNAIDVLIKVLEALAARDPLFTEKLIALPRHGSKRRWVARDRYELYPGKSPEFADQHSHQLPSGEWVGTNYGVPMIGQIISAACQVAGVAYGCDLQVSLR